MIESFGNRLADKTPMGVLEEVDKSILPELRHIARRKLLYLHDAAALKDLRVPQGNRLKTLRGNYRGKHSIRINEQRRIVFRWQNGNAFDVEIVDYH